MDRGAECYRRFLDGDDGGLAEMIEEYADGLTLFLNRYVSNIGLAEELAEETFVRIAVKKPSFKPQATFKTWLYTIGRNIAVSYLRRQRLHIRFGERQTENLEDERAAVERAYIKEENRRALHRALGSVKRDYGVVLYLKFFESQSNAQISAVMKKSLRQVENLLYQAKKAMKAQLEKEGLNYDELQ